VRAPQDEGAQGGRQTNRARSRFAVDSNPPDSAASTALLSRWPRLQR